MTFDKLRSSNGRKARRFALCAVLAVATFAGCSKGGVHLPPSACRLPPDVFKQVSDARGLSFNSSVACRYETPEQIRAYLLSALWKKNPLEKLLFEGELYRALGLLPTDYKYIEQVPQFFSQEISGYYKAEDGSYVMRLGSDPATENDTMHHELTHALQDQHFDIETLLPPDLPTDALLARTAVLEGDADRIMLRLKGLDPCADLEDLSLAAGGQNAAPPALRLFLNFPYVYGRRFWCQTADDGAAQGRVMKNLPRSTREVMHPELYLSENEQLKSVMPSLEPDARFGVPIYHDVIGEFGALALLATYLPLQRASAASNGLVADRAWVFKELNPETTSVVWKSIWESTDQAREFEQALVTACKVRFGTAPSVIEVGGPRVSYFNVEEHGIDHLSIAEDGPVIEVTVLAHTSS